LQKFPRKFWNCEAPSLTNFLVNTLNEHNRHSLQKHLFAHLWTFYAIVLQPIHSLHFGYIPLIIHDGFPQHS
jgi:hypothetical protein